MIDDELMDGCLVMEPRDVFDKCIVGVVERMGNRFVVYSKSKTLAALSEMFADDDDDPELAAIEWYDYNSNGGWYGENTWAFLLDGEDADLGDEDAEAERRFLQPINPDPVTTIAKAMPRKK